MPDTLRTARGAGRWLITTALAVAGIRLCWILQQYYLTQSARRHHVEAAWFLFIAVALAAVAVPRRAPQPETEGVVDRRLPSAARPAPLPLMLAASLVLYWPALSTGLLSDDFVLLSVSPFGNPQSPFFRPLPQSVWAFLFPLAGAPGLHVLNVALHGVNAWLLFRLLRTVVPVSSLVVAAAGASLFLTFPATVEAVAWNSGVVDVALGTWTLVYLIAIADPRPRARFIAIAALIAALLTKETAVALPALALLLSFRRPISLWRLGVSAAVCAVYIGVRLSMIDAPPIEAPLRYFVKEMIVRPFAGLGVPWTDGEVAAAPLWMGVFPPVAIAVLIAGYAVGRRATIRAAVPALWVLAGVAPLLSYLYIGPNLEAGRHLYLPLVGWSVLLAELADNQPGKAPRLLAITLLLAFAAAGAYGIRVHQRPWTAAAALRDQVLMSARAVVEAAGCRDATFTGLPDNVAGAYVFRNGFREAMGGTLETAPAGSRMPAECEFRWSSEGFQR